MTPLQRAREERAPTLTSRISVPDNRGTKVVRAVTVRRSAADLYAFWRDFTNLPQLMRHPVTISESSEGRSHWEISCGDERIAWDLIIINDNPGSLLAWRTDDGATVAHAGSIRFEPAPGDEGTEVTLAVEFDHQQGLLEQTLAKFDKDDPMQQIADALRRFKALMEVGEFPTTEGQTSGRTRRRTRSGRKTV
jgi:uncharacterized membrane protein